MDLHRTIATLTLNPALDTVTEVERVEPSHKMHCGHSLIHPGGGGVNVARALHRLGQATQAVLMLGGLTGERLQALLSEEGVPLHPVGCRAETRTALSVRERSSGLDYRFTLPMHGVTDAEVRQAIATFQAVATPGGWCVVSGSLPAGISAAVMAELAVWAREHGSALAVDTSGEALAAAMDVGVDLIKPSLREFSHWVGTDLTEQDQWRAAARACISGGKARVIALTLGDQGADLITADGAWRASAIQVSALTTVGAGDSFLAGLLASAQRGADWPTALRWAVASSAAALLRPGTALCDPEDVSRLLPLVQITEQS